MSLPPKASGDILTATLWNIVQALAEGAMRGTNNLSEITDPAAAKLALLLHAVATSGAYADLLDRPITSGDGDAGFVIADESGNIALRVQADGTTVIARAEVADLVAALADLDAATVAALTATAATIADLTATAATVETLEATTAEIADLSTDLLTIGATETAVADTVDPVWAIADGNGEVALQVKADGRVGIGDILAGRGVDEYAIAIADPFGEVVGYITPAGVGGGVWSQTSIEPTPTTYSADEIAQRNARALALSAAVITRTNTTAARPVWTYNHVLSYGQSLSNGWEGWPRLSKTQPHDNLMVGDAVHPSSESSSTWSSTGTAAFNALVAKVHSGGAVVDDATVAGYSAGNAARGETVLEGALNMWRRQQLASRGLLSDSTRRLVGSACGVGGKSIEELSKGASPELFNRLRGAANAAKTLAAAASGTYGVPAILWLQGEHNSAGWSGTGDKATYKALCETLQQDVIADIATTIAGQSAPPAFFCYQVGGTYTSDTLELSIPQAQLECAQEFQDWYLVAPSYPVTDKAGHLDPNGYRWLGMQFGKVLHQVLDLGRGWLPLHPIQATWRGSEVLIDFHVPQPPLQFQAAYSVLTATTYAAKGFRVTDDDGAVTISAVDIVSDACVRLTLARTLADNPFVWYGSKTTHNGNGNLCDSDPTIASADYEYASGTGQYAGADIVALKDNPYPLWNWCVLFRMAITYDPAS